MNRRFLALRRLDLSGTHVNDAGVENLQGAMREVWILIPG